MLTKEAYEGGTVPVWPNEKHVGNIHLVITAAEAGSWRAPVSRLLETSSVDRRVGLDHDAGSDPVLAF